MPKFVKITVFWLITLAIVMSLFIIEEIWLILQGYWKISLDHFLQLFKFKEILFNLIKWWGEAMSLYQRTSFQDATIIIILSILMIIFLLTVIVIFVRYWYKKQTIFRAFLLALLGTAMGFNPPVHFPLGVNDSFCFIGMTLFYAFLGLLHILIKKRRPEINLSPLLFWRRPWI